MKKRVLLHRRRGEDRAKVKPEELEEKPAGETEETASKEGSSDSLDDIEPKSMI